MALSAVDCIHRGLFNLRANWELVLIQWLQVLITSMLIVAGLIPPLAVVGWASIDGLAALEDVRQAVESWENLLARGGEAWLLLLASLVVATAIWLMAMLVFCYFQGGILGVLMAGDRQAPGGRPRHWRWFRTFSARDLRGWAGRYLWRYFWLFHLFLLFSLVWLFLPLGLAALTAWGQMRWGSSAAFGIGCGGAIPLAFSVLVLALWFNLAQADLAREASRVWVATRQSLRVLGRRLGAVVLIFALGFLASLSVAVGTWAVSIAGSLLFGKVMFFGVVSQVAASLLQWLASGMVGIALASALIGLVRSESGGEATA